MNCKEIERLAIIGATTIGATIVCGLLIAVLCARVALPENPLFWNPQA